MILEVPVPIEQTTTEISGILFDRIGKILKESSCAADVTKTFLSIRKETLQSELYN